MKYVISYHDENMYRNNGMTEGDHRYQCGVAAVIFTVTYETVSAQFLAATNCGTNCREMSKSRDIKKII